MSPRPRGSIETRSRPHLLAATRHGFTFYVADPVSSIRGLVVIGTLSDCGAIPKKVRRKKPKESQK